MTYVMFADDKYQKVGSDITHKSEPERAHFLLLPFLFSLTTFMVMFGLTYTFR